MKEELRRTIAVNAAARINNRRPSGVYSYDRGQHSNMSPNYDYETGAHIGGSDSGLYHYGLGSHVSLKVNGSSFSGYDYGDGHHFSGRVNGNSVQIAALAKIINLFALLKSAPDASAKERSL